LHSSIGAIGEAMNKQRLGSRTVMDALERLRGITGRIEQGALGIAASRASVVAQVERLHNVNEVVVRNNEEITQGTREINESVTATTDMTISTATLITEAMSAADKFRLE
jgi:methyl-accepting chemotaxis protein